MNLPSPAGCRRVQLPSGMRASVCILKYVYPRSTRGSAGGSCDNALAEAISGLHKAEVIHRRSWRNREQMEPATQERMHGYNTGDCRSRSGTSRQRKHKRLTIGSNPVRLGRPDSSQTASKEIGAVQSRRSPVMRLSKCKPRQRR